jgi:hypothetical protein
LEAHGGRVADSGEVLEIQPLRKLVLKWRNEFMPEMRVEGCSRATIELDPAESLDPHLRTIGSQCQT